MFLFLVVTPKKPAQGGLNGGCCWVLPLVKDGVVGPKRLGVPHKAEGRFVDAAIFAKCIADLESLTLGVGVTLVVATADPVPGVELLGAFCVHVLNSLCVVVHVCCSLVVG